MPRMSIADALRLALEHLQAGRGWETEMVCRSLLATVPEEAEAHRMLGLGLWLQDRTAEALEALDRSASLRPGNPFVHDNRSVILLGLGRAEEAEQAALQALSCDPQFASAAHNLGTARVAQNRPAEAETALKLALSLRPDLLQSYVKLAEVYKSQGRWAEAEDACRTVLSREPGNPEALFHLGAILQRQQRLLEAERVYRQALAVMPDTPSLLNNLGNTLLKASRLQEAEDLFHRALAIDPLLAEAHNNLGQVAQGRYEFPSAEACFRKAIELQPHMADAWNNLAYVLQFQGKVDEAEAACRRATDLSPASADFRAALAFVLQLQGRVSESIAEYDRAAELAPDLPTIGSNQLCCRQYLPGITAAELAGWHRRWAQRLAPPPRVPLPGIVRRAGHRLRLGFLSPDFAAHPVGLFLSPVLPLLDRGRFECFVYCDRLVHDGVTAQLQAAADHWLEVRGLNHDQLEERIRQDQIDILFDLSGHTANNRLLVFARKPAPVQIAWVGYPGTTGLAAIDYLLADRYQVPEGEESHYTERVLRLPDGYVCFPPPDEAPEVGPLPASVTGQVTFACFNNPAKINHDVVTCWSQILTRVRGSRLRMKFLGLDSPSVARRFLAAFAEAGIDDRRIELSGWSPRGDLLAAYNQVDLALDPFPYSGGLTTCEALWMGVPVITFPGQTFAGRHSTSHLSAVGLTQAIAADREGYVELAVKLAHNLGELAEIRATLRQQMLRSPLCDAPRFARHLGAILEEIAIAAPG